MGGFRERVKSAISDNSLTLALYALFLVCIGAQALTGWFAYDSSLTQAGLSPLPFGPYLGTGHFLDGIFSNWQAAILQLAVLISLSSVLRQKGAAHSRKSPPPKLRALQWKLQSRPTLRGVLYANSLSLAFFSLFVVTFGLHLLFGEWSYNEQQALRRLSPTTLAAYAGSADFWDSVFQCWEAEFWAIAVYIVLSIFLRQESSSESKPVGASDEATGETNE